MRELHVLLHLALPDDAGVDPKTRLSPTAPPDNMSISISAALQLVAQTFATAAEAPPEKMRQHNSLKSEQFEVSFFFEFEVSTQERNMNYRKAAGGTGSDDGGAGSDNVGKVACGKGSDTGGGGKSAPGPRKGKGAYLEQ